VVQVIFGTIVVIQMISLLTSWQATNLTPSKKTEHDFHQDHMGPRQGTLEAKLLLLNRRGAVQVQASWKSHVLWKEHYHAPLKSCIMEPNGG
jgi:hypothetical protein